MKKISSFVLGLLFAGFLSYGLVSAQISGLSEDSIKGLFVGDDALFGYDEDHKLSVKNISDTSITFESPVLDDIYGKITEYVLLYGKHSFDELLSDPKLLSSFTEVSFSADGNADTLTMTLNSSLDANAIYYVVAIPMDDYESLGSVSNQMCFKLKDKLYGEGDECVNGTAKTSVTHASDEAWENSLKLANISCTWDGKKITLSRVPISNMGKVRISLYNESTNNFTKLGEVDASTDRTFSFNVNQNHEPLVRFDDTEGLSAYKTYTCHRLSTSTSTSEPTTPTKNTGKVPTVPTVGPKENILAIIAGALVLYVFYRVVRRKAD